MPCNLGVVEEHLDESQKMPGNLKLDRINHGIFSIISDLNRIVETILKPTVD